MKRRRKLDQEQQQQQQHQVMLPRDDKSKWWRRPALEQALGQQEQLKQQELRNDNYCNCTDHNSVKIMPNLQIDTARRGLLPLRQLQEPAPQNPNCYPNCYNCYLHSNSGHRRPTPTSNKATATTTTAMRQQALGQRRRPRHIQVTMRRRTFATLLVVYIMATSLLPLLFTASHLWRLVQVQATQAVPSERMLKFDPMTSSYSGLTFTFDPRLDKQVERLHFDHWLSIMQQSSSLLYDSLNGRAHLAEVRVLIPYKWRQFEWPVLHKPGSPIITNRRLRYADSDVIVGHEGKSIVPVSLLF